MDDGTEQGNGCGEQQGKAVEHGFLPGTMDSRNIGHMAPAGTYRANRASWQA
ncbi:hypothetical protein GCM10007907_23890 [Chitinimonas prasina]|uniref:Uncharacterized protein n=1 Tax=Chitinimonas prasina TaxID=1434937 RepID=A0ABQ5YFX0_9NEIS|nr:hypothetical protein GCM10007907_23890 [Chitinimonas prasina]